MTENPLTAENVDTYADADIISPFIYSDLSTSTLDHFMYLKMIATRSTGYDHIATDYCRSRGIIIANVPEYASSTVAEHVFGLLLTISHNIAHAVERTGRGDFSLQGLQGFDLRGKTIGVVGTGAIGLQVIGIAKGFGMDIMAYDVKPKRDLESRLGFRYVPMEALLSSSDIITLHVPAIRATENLISYEQFDVMKTGVVIINTARGSIIDTNALLKALAEGKVAAAGLDVLPEEPVIQDEAELLRMVYQKKNNLQTLLADHLLLRLRNVYITPHSAFYTREAVQRLLDTTVDNIESFAQGNPRNVVVGAEREDAAQVS